MKRKRRNHSASFKAKVALAAVESDKTVIELSEQFDVHPNQIQDWKKQLVSGAEGVFGRGAKQAKTTDETVQELHAKIGQLTMENDFLGRGLERIHGPRGKKW